MGYHISMARRLRRCIITMLIAAAAMSSLNAGRAFDVLHSHYRDALERGHITRAINLYKPISMRLHDLKHELQQAYADGDEEKIAAVTSTMDDYRKYLVTEEEAQRMGILRLSINQPEKLMEASIFLYENTEFFRPTITIRDECGKDSQVHVWMAKPGTTISFDHEYDDDKLDGRIFTGYRRTDGTFRRGEYPTFTMSYDSEVWDAVYEYGFVFRDPYYGYEIFYPLNDDGCVEIPSLDWLSSDQYKLAGWKEEDTGKVIASQHEDSIEFDGRSTTLVPIWEYVELEQLHIGNRRKMMTNGSEELFYIDLTNHSNHDVTLLVDAYTYSQDCIADRVFEFITMKKGETTELGPYRIEALMGTEDEDIYFKIKVKSLESGNQWTYTPSLSIR